MPKAKKASRSKKTTTKATTTKKVTAVKQALTKTQLYTALADDAGVTKKQVTAVFDGLGEVIERHIKKRGVGEFTLPGLLKVKVVRKPATKARKGINPFTREETIFKAKPARNVVKLKALKKLKEMVD